MPVPRTIVDAESIRAGQNLTGGGTAIPKHRLVQDGAAVQEVALCTGVGDIAMGVTMEQIEDGVTGDVQTNRKAIVEAGAAVAIGAEITSDAVGRSVTAVSTNQSHGRTVTAAGALGDLHEVELFGTPRVLP